MPAGTRRVQRLLRWYPPSWRARYGEEFAELLLSEEAEQPRSWRRYVNVAASGMLARCTSAGLTSHQLPAAEQIRVGLATLGCSLAVFATLGVAMLAQLAMGWQWATTPMPSAAVGTLTMTAAAACLGLIVLAAAVPVCWHAARSVVGQRNRRLAWPAAIVLTSAAVLVFGTRHFENGWPGTGGTGAEHSLVPGGLAAFGWASTLSVSAYWAHPHFWGSFPASELAWMMLSPLAGIALVAGLAAVVRRLILPPPLQRYLAWLAVGASAAACAFLAGAASWVLGHGSGAERLFRPGAIDRISLLVMAVALGVALRAAAGIRHARLALPHPD
jgi:hypothetical protein